MTDSDVLDIVDKVHPPKPVMNGDTVTYNVIAVAHGAQLMTFRKALHATARDYSPEEYAALMNPTIAKHMGDVFSCFYERSPWLAGASVAAFVQAPPAFAELFISVEHSVGLAVFRYFVFAVSGYVIGRSFKTLRDIKVRQVLARLNS